MRNAPLSLGTRHQIIKNGRLLVTPKITVEDYLLKTTDAPSTGSIMNKYNDQEVRQ